MQQPDNTLVLAAKQGDTQAFEQLILQNQSKVYNLAYRMTGNSEDALDVSQEAFIKAWQALPNFKGESSFSTWMYRLTSNCAIDLLRKHKRKPQSSLTTNYLEDEEGSELQIPDQRFDPSHALQHKELGNAIEKGLRLLPPHHRDVLIMREIDGLSYHEISTTLALDLGTVKSRIARGRMALRKFLTKENMTPDS